MAEQGVFTCSRFESRGSTYEGVKVKKSATDDDLEFDIICVMEGGKDLQATPIPGTPGYATLKPRTGKESRPVFQKTMDKNNAISAEKLRNLFYAHLDKCNFPNVKKKYHGPAVELDYWRDGRKFFSVDLAPHFDLGSNELYVPKAPRDNSKTEAWFRSYTMDEKKKFDGLDRDNGCRKMVLRILKVSIYRLTLEIKKEGLIHHLSIIYVLMATQLNPNHNNTSKSGTIILIRAFGKRFLFYDVHYNL